MTARFVTLEGGDGVGKSTQARRLAAALEDRGLRVCVTREPGGTPGAEAIRALLLDPAARWSARAEALLFAAARADHLERRIVPALAAGEWVVCDRFLDSTRAYQGIAGTLADGDILAMHRAGSGGRMPDRTLLLDLPDGSGVARAAVRDAGAADRFGLRDDEYHRAVAAQFRRLADADPDRIRRVDASGSEEAVTARLLGALSDLVA